MSKKNPIQVLVDGQDLKAKILELSQYLEVHPNLSDQEKERIEKEIKDLAVKHSGTGPGSIFQEFKNASPQ